ncbi:hypothetical protein F5Y10DRAFT_259415 [Nemania abortiva]|nr:hypothetical protein F5Y10DRAFT_259415 [Nemania abortiva]
MADTTPHDGREPPAAQKTRQLENTEKRDVLVKIERRFQKQWADDHVFDAAAPSIDSVPLDAVSPEELRAQQPKFFGTVAYPYMNGSLHVGHGFTISKVEFAAGYARMRGKRVLMPLGFHCTGMAIKACADKLVREMDMFGRNFERYVEALPIRTKTDADANAAAHIYALTPAAADVTVFKSNKSKAVAKAGKAKFQFQIMLSLGIPREEIHRFADPYHWVNVFPNAGMHDLVSFGMRADWRRSFVTTDANPYYDSFVRWQMNKLKDLGKIKFGKRYTVYSPLDKQPCLDHDRSDGEGIGVQQYTAIKMPVLEWANDAGSVTNALPATAKVYFVAATLRPETMYGQTCCFVGPNIIYGIFHVSNNDYFLISRRSARNMAFQNIFPEWGVCSQVAEVSGKQVIGTLVEAPLSFHKTGIRILPMETVTETKGTGIVTSVPSDSPDDYATVTDLTNKPDYYGIRKEWAELEVVPIIETPAYGNLIAPTLVQKHKVRSAKDPKLAELKDIAYKEGFYNGTMLVGEFKGKVVQEAKILVKNILINSGQAFEYAEPDGLVISRSRDECVAAHLDQWYLNYGTEENGGDGNWCSQVIGHLNSGDLNTFSTEAKNQFEKTLGWLGQWSCARSYGLGSELPWDHGFLVESLSDSTIYPAYYTVAHYLHQDLYGSKQGLGAISADQMTDEVWDFIFARANTVNSDINPRTLQSMRREFTYWYPVDLRVSGKDLIQNHLTFFIYIHVAMWPKEYWPRGIRPNGHLLLNGEKMAKSTGNFLTLREAVAKFGADAARITIADAGDSIEDANFEETVANKTILKLYELKKWLEEMILEPKLIDSLGQHVQLRDSHPGKSFDTTQRIGDFNFWDKLFQNELRYLVAETEKSYDSLLFKAAVRFGFYDLTALRDFYREATRASGCRMHHDLVRYYAKLQALLLAPIAPHWADYIWRDVLGMAATVNTASFPERGYVNAKQTATLNYIRSVISNIASAQAAQAKRLAKGKQTPFDPSKPYHVTIFCTTALSSWQRQCVDLLHSEITRTGDASTLEMKTVSQSVDKKHAKKAIPFVVEAKRRIAAGEPSAVVLSKEPPFDELTALHETDPILRQILPQLENVSVLPVGENGQCIDGSVPDALVPIAAGALPQFPTYYFANS